MNGKGDNRIINRVMSAAIMCIIFLAVLVLVVFSARTYKGSVDIQNSNYDTRAAIGYVITAVKANKTDTIYLEETDSSNMLVISDSVSGLEQHIYYRDGELIENYGQAGREFVPDGEEVIGYPSMFEMSMENDSLLRISTEYGDSFVNIKN